MKREPNGDIAISIVIPVYKEELNITPFLNRLNPVLEKISGTFEIIFALDPSPDKTEQVILENTKANITTRNFPDSVEEIRKKWKINDGGSTYCFFTTDLNNDKIVLLCSKI